MTYRDPETGEAVTLPVTGGAVKLQWKPDWGMRWSALGVDYEMAGKDLIDSVKLSSKICGIIGGRPPEGFNYELFLDENGEKISKSRGNGLTVDEWLRYGSPESLALFMFNSPKSAKRLHFDVIPRQVDDYLAFLKKYPEQAPKPGANEPNQQLDNPVWHIHNGKPVDYHSGGVSFGMLLNLASVAHTEDKEVLWQYLRRYVPGATPENAPYIDRLLSGAVAYYQDFVKASKKFRLPAGQERAALQDLADTLRRLPEDSTAEFIQNEVYEAGKRHFAKEELRQWFQTLYEVLLGSSQGPRMGAFIKLYGRDNVVKLIDRALAGEDLSKAA